MENNVLTKEAVKAFVWMAVIFLVAAAAEICVDIAKHAQYPQSIVWLHTERMVCVHRDTLGDCTLVKPLAFLKTREYQEEIRDSCPDYPPVDGAGRPEACR